MNDYLIVKTIKNHNHGDFFNLYPVTIGPFIRGKSSRLIFPRINGPNMHCKLNEPIRARRKRRKTRQQITTDFDWLRTCRETFESITRH